LPCECCKFLSSDLFLLRSQAFNEGQKLAVPSAHLEPNSSDSVLFKTQESVNIISALTASSPIKLPPRKPSLIEHATPPSRVSAFCRAVLAHLIPHEFWGSGETQVHNEKILFRNVDRFITLRRFESLSLHEVSQGTRVGLLSHIHPTYLHPNAY
jgi:Telomerase ribonucleoprotein complex - RNA binding domain